MDVGWNRDECRTKWQRTLNGMATDIGRNSDRRRMERKVTSDKKVMDVKQNEDGHQMKRIHMSNGTRTDFGRKFDEYRTKVRWRWHETTNLQWWRVTTQWTCDKRHVTSRSVAAHNKCRTVSRGIATHDRRHATNHKIYIFYLTLHLVSKVYKAKAFAQEREKKCVFARERKRKTSPRYITPPFAFALLNSSDHGYDGWQKCNNTGSLRKQQHHHHQQYQKQHQ